MKHWLPELQQIPAVKVHEPWRLTAGEQARYGVQIGVDYPEPVVDLHESAALNERLYLRALRDRKRRTCMLGPFVKTTKRPK